MKFRPTLFTLSAVYLLVGCSLPTRQSPANQPSPLVLAACPAPTPLSDDSMGALLVKVVEQGNTYRDCREAALAGQPIPKADYSLWPKKAP